MAAIRQAYGYATDFQVLMLILGSAGQPVNWTQLASVEIESASGRRWNLYQKTSTKLIRE